MRKIMIILILLSSLMACQDMRHQVKGEPFDVQEVIDLYESLPYFKTLDIKKICKLAKEDPHGECIVSKGTKKLNTIDAIFKQYETKLIFIIFSLYDNRVFGLEIMIDMNPFTLNDDDQVKIIKFLKDKAKLIGFDINIERLRRLLNVKIEEFQGTGLSLYQMDDDIIYSISLDELPSENASRFKIFITLDSNISTGGILIP